MCIHTQLSLLKTPAIACFYSTALLQTDLIFFYCFAVLSQSQAVLAGAHLSTKQPNPPTYTHVKDRVPFLCHAMEARAHIAASNKQIFGFLGAKNR